MKAFVMAAGLGTRLRPLTYSVPKPLVPIVNVPVIGYLMQNLSKSGVKEVIINLHYRPELVRSFLGNGSKWGLKVNYSYEEKLLGTAGGVKLKQSFFKETFIVTSGDGLTDLDFKKAVKYHKERKAIATVVLKPVDMRIEYGVVKIDNYNRIIGFYEKPSLDKIFTNLVNTGIYIFEPEIFKYIPDKKFYDFGSQLLPKLVKQNLPVYGFIADGYWCDVGNLSEYRRANHDCIDGKVNMKIQGRQILKKIWVGEDTILPKSVKFKAPCVIGNKVKIGENCLIGEYTVIGNNCIIGDNVYIRDSILWDNVVVRTNVKLDSCIIARNAVVSESITMFDGTVLNVEI